MAEDGAGALAVGGVEQVQTLAEPGHERRGVLLLRLVNGNGEAARHAVGVDRRLEARVLPDISALVIPGHRQMGERKKEKTKKEGGF